MTANVAPRRLLTGASRKTVLTLHISSSVALLGSSAGLLLAGLRAATRNEPAQAHTIYELMQLLVFTLGIPCSFLALLSGAALGLTSRWGLVRYWWVTTKLVLLLATILTGALVTGRSIDAMLDDTAPGGTGDDGARWTLVYAVAAQLTMVVTANVLAVFKPAGRTPWARG
jgi:hypothetical protein